MDLHTITASGFEDKLKCFLCKNYLSYFPISLCSNNQSICGRCTAREEVTSFRDEAYETVCQFFKFPCRYKSEGCPEELVPKEVPQHELTCPYRLVNCIVTKPNPCKWVGALPSLLPHCKEQHSSIILPHRAVKMSISSSDENDYLIETDGNLLVLSNKFDSQSKIWQFAVYSHQYESDCKKSVCQWTVKNGSTTLTHEFNITSFTEKTFTKLSLQSLENDSKDNEIIEGQFSINSSTTKYDASSKMKDLELEEIYSKMSTLFRCCLCSQIAVPHVYRRVIDMSIVCSGCSVSIPRKQCSKVNSCQRDHELDTLAAMATYPCVNKLHGCKYKSKHNEIKIHEDTCEYKFQKCPFYGVAECKWTGVKNDSSAHIISEHQDLLIASGTELNLTAKNVVVKYRAIRLPNSLYRLGYCLDADDYFKWSVEAITDGVENRKFEVDIVDITKRGQRLLMKKFCPNRLSEQEEMFKDASKCCYFQKDQVCLFAENKDLDVTFKVRVFN